MVVSTPNRTETVDAESLIAALEVVASFLSSFEPGLYSPEDAALLLSSFTRGENLCAAGKAHCAHRMAEANVHLRTGHRSPSEWLASATGESVGEAGRLLRLGETLSDQPTVDEAFRKGELSVLRARLVADAARINPDQEADLVEGARGRDTLRQVKDRCLRAKAQGRTPEQERRHDEALHAARSLRTFTDQNGAFHLQGVFHPVAGARLSAVLQVRSDRIFRQARTDGLRESPDAYRADALVALVTGGSGPSGPSPDGSGPAGSGADSSGSGSGSSPRTKGSHPEGTGPSGSDSDGPDSAGSGSAGSGSSSRAKGSGASSPPSDGAPEPTRCDPRATVHLRVDLAALRRGALDDGEICEIPGVGPVSLRTARELMGDALVKIVITDGVDVTTVVHPGRHLPEVLKTAVFERDQRCVIEGCDTRLGLETDHWLIDYADDGPLSLHNAVRLCRHHHDLKTHRGYTVEGRPGHWRLVPPKHPKLPKRPKRKTGRSPTGTKRPSRPRPAKDPPLFTVEE